MTNWRNLGNRSKSITSQDGNGDSLSKYFSEIRDFKSLTKEEERALIIVIQSKQPGYKLALDKLIKANLKFVVTVAKQYQGQGASLIDLISEGNGGLCHAVGVFDTSKDLKFFSYAVWWIRLQMFKSLYNDGRTIRLPDNRALFVKRIKEEVQILEQRLERSPSVEELLDFIKVTYPNDLIFRVTSIQDIYEAIMLNSGEWSIDDVTVNKGDDSDENIYLKDMLAGDDNLGIDTDNKQESLETDLNRFFFNLAQKEYDVLALYMGLNGESILKSIDIAKVLGIKEKEVIKLRQRAVKRLKGLKNIDSLKDYL
jgi:RNA polymerase primary sigma factor